MKRFPLTPELVNQIREDGMKGAIDQQMLRNQVVLGNLPQEMLTALKIPDLEVVTLPL